MIQGIRSGLPALADGNTLIETAIWPPCWPDTSKATSRAGRPWRGTTSTRGGAAAAPGVGTV